MPTGPTGASPHPRNATTREQTVLDELYRAGQHADGLRESAAIRAGVSLLVELIQTRHQRAENGFSTPPGGDE